MAKEQDSSGSQPATGTTKRSRRCFVISPIGQAGSEIREHADDVFRYIIQPAMAELGIQAVRSDQLEETGSITEQMFDEILGSDLCVAVLTGANPNVYYELAVAQAGARPVILLIEEGSALPFDIKDLRCVQYSLRPISRLVEEKVYANEVVKLVRGVEDQGWMEPSLFERYGYEPQLRYEQQLQSMIREARPDALPARLRHAFGLPFAPDRRIAIATGDIRELKGVVEADVVVNLEDTHLQLARYFDPSISGSLRFLDAQQEGGRIVRDAMREELDGEIQRLGIYLPMSPGSVVATRTHGLAELGYKYVFHVAAMDGAVGDGYRTMFEALDDCVRNAFARFAEIAREDAPEGGIQSILFPMLGAGTSGHDPVEVARKLLVPIVAMMRNVESCRTAFVLAWLESHVHALNEVVEELELEEVREPSG